VRFRFAALVFDMDGTMVDNMGVHIDVWKEFGRRRGWAADAPDYEEKVGHGTLADVLGRVFGRPATAAELDSIGEAKEALYRETYASRMAPVPGLRELLAAARAAGVRIAMATNGNRANADFVLDGLGLREDFGVVVVGSDVRRGKPDPETFALAVSRLGLPPARCVAFEDSPHGIASAKSAGLSAVGLATTFAHDPARLSAADLVVPDFLDPRLGRFLSLT
jgi:HAD superfamily hydrolase (TIGR01509 family)